MIELEKRYVLHITKFKCVDGELVALDIEELLDGLFFELKKGGIVSFYLTDIKSHYKSRVFDEVTVTVFASSIQVEEIFKRWFRANNHVLEQESFSYEHGNRMIIEKLD